MNPVSSLTMATLEENTAKTTASLRAKGYTVVEKWGHDFQQDKKNNKELKSFLETETIMDRLNPREAFFGGRTNATTLYYEGEAKYIDFTSLYPWVRKFFMFIYVFNYKLLFFFSCQFFLLLGKQILLISCGSPRNPYQRLWGCKHLFWLRAVCCSTSKRAISPCSASKMQWKAVFPPMSYVCFKFAAEFL